MHLLHTARSGPSHVALTVLHLPLTRQVNSIDGVCDMHSMSPWVPVFFGGLPEIIFSCN